MDTSLLGGLDSFQAVFYFTNNQVGGLLFIGGIIILYLVMLMVLLKNGEPFINGFAVSSWVAFLVSAFLWLAKLLPMGLPLCFLFLSGLSVLVLYSSKS